MKYANSLKYMNSFPSAAEGFDISQRRIRDLCMSLGRINIGMKYICLPKSSAGHACAVMLESVIKNAGYRVGRITSVTDFDSRTSVTVNCAIPSIEDYNKCVFELKAVMKKTPDESFLKEEVSFVLSLLLCRLSDCQYVILEGLSDKEHNIDSICAPYDLIVMPTVYDSHSSLEKIKYQCESIRRGTREVISGNQKSEVYNCISNACAVSGVRLYIPVKSRFAVSEVTSRKLVFQYGEREGYVLKSPSHLLRDCAMTVIETALAIRRDGVKLPWNAIMSGLANANDTCCFDMLSASPKIVTDSADSRDEIELVMRTADEVWGEVQYVSLLTNVSNAEDLNTVLEAFRGREIKNLMVVNENFFDTEGLPVQNIVFCKKVSDAIKEAIKLCKADELLLCFGGITFSTGIKNEFIKQMSI